MEFCSSDHEEVCYEDRECPVCEVLERYNGFDDAVSETKSEVENFVSDVGSQISALRKIFKLQPKESFWDPQAGVPSITPKQVEQLLMTLDELEGIHEELDLSWPDLDDAPTSSKRRRHRR